MLRHSPFRVAVIALAIWLTVPSFAFAQTLPVKVVDAGTGAPIPGSMVIALGPNDSQIAGGFTSESGVYVFRNLRSKPVVLVARHIGFAPARFQIDAASDGASAISLKLTPLPSLLSAVVTNEKSECKDLSDAGTTISQVWENIRSALEATRFAEDEGLVRIEIERYEQDLSGNLVATSPRIAKLREVRTGQPFAAASAAALAQNGYVVGKDSSIIYFAPDARTLLSSEFTSSHCFSIRRPKRGDDPALIGLAFEPLRGVRGSNVAGTLWVNRETGGLDRMVFDYVNVQAPVSVKGVGGRLDFQQLPTGAWFITHWHILTPRLGRFQRVTAYRREAVDTLLGFHEAGGNARPLAATEVVAVADSARQTAGTPLAPAKTTAPTFPDCPPDQRKEGIRLQGGIRDSAGRAVRNSTLTIEWSAAALNSPNGRAVVAGERGQIIDVEPDGNGLYTVCGLPTGAEFRMRLIVDGRKIEDRRVPSGAIPTTILANFVVSPQAAQIPALSSLVGLVRDDAAVPKPIANAEVQVANVTTRTDSTGRFVVNGISPATQDITIKRVGFIQLRTSLDFSAGKPMARVFVLSPIRTRLDTVQVVAARTPSILEGYEERRRLGIGSAITREQLEKQGDRQVSEILRSLPSIHIVNMGGSDAAVATQRGGRGLTSVSKGGDAVDKMRGADMKACYAQVFIDGVRVFVPLPDRPLFNINSLTPGTIEGIEYFRGAAETPVQYSTANAECGTLLIWTRRGPPSK